MRKNRKGGGLLLAICESFEPVLIYEGDDDIEILVAQGTIERTKVRFINAYGPQEDDATDRILGFYQKLEEEIVLALENGCQIILECDANAKLGFEVIPGAPNCQSSNGGLLWSLLKRNNLTVVNSLDLCEGVITRHRITKNSEEKSVLDYLIISDGMCEFISKMVVDEDKIDVLTKYVGRKGLCKLVKSDHNMLIGYFNLTFTKELKNKRIEVFNFKNPLMQERFLQETSGDRLVRCFNPSNSLEQNSQSFKKTLTSIVHKCFKKVRVRTDKPSVIDEKLHQLDVLKRQSKEGTTTVGEVNKLEIEVQEQCAVKNAEAIREHVENLSNLSGTFSSNMMWKLKKKVCRRPAEPPMAKKDSKGNIITSPTALKQLYRDEYVYRLRHREIRPTFSTLKCLREDLWEERFKLLSKTSSKDWNLEDVTKVMRSLKTNKCRDPLGLSNELFKPGVCGPDLVKAIMILANACKNEVCTPTIMQYTDISTIYKNKGSRFDLVNDRGIFNMVILRKIIDRLIYNDKYEYIDNNMSDSNVGGRKRRNIRNHLFIVYGVINSVMNKESPPVDIQFYDLKQCFDAMWLEESMNNLCDTIPTEEWDNKLALVYQNNCSNNVAVKTPFGLTDRVSINKIVTQGGVWGPIQCSNQVDRLGKECEERNIHLYTYKGMVKILPLAMIDDILAIANCGIKSVGANTFINTKTELNKLEFSEPKCKHMYVGEECPFCPVLEVHGHEISKTTGEKYLGDIVGDTILGNGCNSKNVANRRSKGLGFVAQIMSILDTVSLGYFVFDIGTLLRESLLVNGILFNTEVWYGVSKSHIKELEDVDKLLLRSLLRAPISTPGEAFYLELGIFPLTYFLKGRRIMFLYYLLQQKTDEMLWRFFHVQWNHPSRNDWVLTVREDLRDLGITLNLDEIKSMSKEAFKELVKQKCSKLAFSNLLKLKSSHSKLKNLSYDNLAMQPYLVDGAFTEEDVRLIFLFRTRMIDVRNNYKNMYTDHRCPLCAIEFDTQEHLLTCPKLPVSGNILYKDIYGSDTTRMKVTFTALKTALSSREEILKQRQQQQPATTTATTTTEDNNNNTTTTTTTTVSNNS